MQENGSRAQLHMAEKDKQRTYVCIDLKSFYASVEARERHLDPMTVKLVVADPSRTEKTICLAVSPALKAYGIPGRARLFEVHQKLSQVERNTGEKVEFIIAPPRMQLYLEYAAEIYTVYLQFVSKEDIHVYSIDEVFIDVTDYLDMYQMTAWQLAVQMIKEVLRVTGITATAGIGTNLYLAKIAMDINAKHVQADEDGVRIAQLNEISYRQSLWNHRPLKDFWRIGGGIASRLEKMGIFTMGDLARMSTSQVGIDRLYHAFGIDAELLIDHAWGYEPCLMSHIKNYKPSTNCLSSGQVLQEPYTVEKARVIVQEMTDLLVLDMVEKKVKTSNLTLTLGYDRCSVDDGTYQGEIKVDFYGRCVPKPAHGSVNLGSHTSSTKKIMEAVLHLYDQITDASLLVRRVTINANDLKEISYEQYDLFTAPEELEKEEKVQKAMLDIQKRFGKNAILKGTSLQEGATTMERNQQIGGHKA